MTEPLEPSRALPPGTPSLEVVQARVPAVPEPPSLYGYPVEQEAHFWDYWQVLSRRRWTVISVFVVTALVAIVWTFTTRPIYTGTATLRIEKEQPRIVKFEEVVKESDTQQDYYQTQYKILQSRSLANRVIGLLQLDQHPEFQDADADRGWGERLQSWMREQLVRWVPLPPPAAPEPREDLMMASPFTEAFLYRLSIEPVRNSRLVKVSFDSHQPDLAARVANTLADAFIAQQLDQRVEATRYASQFLAQQLDETRDKLGKAEDQLNQFLKAADILFVAADKSGQPQDLVTQQLTILSEALLKARGERIAKESLVTHAASAKDPDALPAVLQSQLIAKLKEELVKLEGEHKQLGEVFKPEYPKMQQLSQKIGETRRQLRGEVDRAVQAVQSDYQAAVRNEREMESALAAQRLQARDMTNRMAQYNLLRREVDTNRELYTALLGRLRETQVSAALFTSNISVVDRAEISTIPSRPRKQFNLLLAGVLGLAGGIGLAFLFEYLDTNIKDAREVEALLRVPILGLVPSWNALNGRRGRRREVTGATPANKPFALVAHTEMASISAEAFRGLRTNLLYSTPERPPKTIMATSLSPEDGKTSLVTNLAITLAQLGSGAVLLIDADMRRPDLHEVLEIEQAPGLSTYLTGQVELDTVIKPTAVPNLFAIPAGRNPINPAELLASTRIRQMMEALGQRYAHIIFDTGPLFGVSDAMILAGQVEGVILVLRQGRASRDGALRAIRNLVSVHGRLLGVILNDVDLHGHGYYGYYGYYGYGHKDPA
jgi:capsular exopolysaccharide synthesis family protein